MSTGFFRKTYNKSRMSPPVNAPEEPLMRPLTETEMYRRSVFVPHVEQVNLPGVNGGIRDLAMEFTGLANDSIHIVPNQNSPIPSTVLVLGSVSR